MNLKSLFFKKFMGGGNFIQGHFVDALIRKKRTGNPYKECLRDSILDSLNEVANTMKKTDTNNTLPDDEHIK